MSDPYPPITPAQRQFGKIALLLVILTLIGNVAAFSYMRPYGVLRDLGPLTEAREHIHRYYVGEVDDQALIDGALRGMADALGDPNTTYFSAEDFSAFIDQVAGEFTGIGAEIGLQEDRLLIVAPLDNSPAMKAGLKPGDIVLEIDGVSTLGLGVEESVTRIKGKEGTVVTLKVRHPDGQVLDIPITRAKVAFSTVRGFRRNPGNGYHYMLDSANKIAYLRLTQFGDTSLKEVEDTLTQLESQGMQALIFDLRDNPGGLLDAAARMADLFLTADKTIVSTQGKGPATEVLQSTGKTMLPNLPLIFLINEGSASASEILAGAMRDNDRALLVGSRSYGKGSVQQVPRLGPEQDRALKLTTAYWYLPSGKLIHRKPDAKQWGVDPSPGCWVPMDVEQLQALLLKRREAEVNDPFADLTQPVTPAFIRDELLDAPLAAGLEAAQHMLTHNDWPQVGVTAEVALAKPTERQTLERRKQTLLDELKQLDEQIDALPADASPMPEEQPAP